MAKNKILPVLALFLVLAWISAPLITRLSHNKTAPISGEISLTLDKAIIREWQKDPIILNLRCDNGAWENEAFAFGFQRTTLKHVYFGTLLKADVSKRRVKLLIKLRTRFYKGREVDDYYRIDLERGGDGLNGRYTGTFNGIEGSSAAYVAIKDVARRLGLKIPDEKLKKLVKNPSKNISHFVYNFPLARRTVSGKISPLPPKNVIPQKNEHPRLVFRKADIGRLKEAAKSPEGRAIISRLKKLLSDTNINYGDYAKGAPDSGYHAAGHGLLYILTGDKKEAEMARELIEKSIVLPAGKSKMIRRSPLVLGIALAYDLCYDAWDDDFRVKIAGYLHDMAKNLFYGGGIGYNDRPQSNWYGITRSVSGLASLAVLGDDLPPGRVSRAYAWLKTAEYSVRQYLDIGIGDHGLCSEGEGYLAYTMQSGLLPFLAAYKTALGRDFPDGGNAKWLLPFFIMNTIKNGDELLCATYGPSGDTLGPTGIFAMGMGVSSPEFKPAVKWACDKFFGFEGDKTFDILKPHHAIYALSDTLDTVRPKDPEGMLPRVLVDNRKGYYAFRDGWKGADDFVATIYLKSQPLGSSHSYADAGSFRIFGFGFRWADKDDRYPYKRKGENVVLIPGMADNGGAREIFFKHDAGGSGVLTVDMSGVYGHEKNGGPEIKAIRSFAVDYSGLSGAAALYVVVDKYSGGGEKEWLMHTHGAVTLSKNGFTIKGPSDASMAGSFITPKHVKLSLTDGKTIKAAGGDEFFVVMTVQKGKAPEIAVSGEGLDAEIRAGKRTIAFRDGNIVFVE